MSEFRFIPPCSPATAKSVPAGDDWLHEPKLDGYRIYSRRGYDWSKRLSSLAEDLRSIPAHSAVLDAELCLPGPGGAPDFFQLLKSAFGSQGSELDVYAFDLLYLNVRNLTPLFLIERRELLERSLSRAKVDCLHLADAQRLFEAAERPRLEGVVSKRKTVPYCSGECDDW